MDLSSYSALQLERQGRFLRAAFNRPESLNPMVQAVSQHRPEAAGARRVGRLSAYEALSNVTADHQEAVRAIREQRDPKFIGR